ncbi:MAG: DUF1566 domain-containing protein [Arcobacteraceae bacterium]|jgi:TPR repeat protein|nr:DUF1566 domain-containing protein [Arcobacteraceae bacterium]
MKKFKFQLLTILFLSSLANSEMIQIEDKSGVTFDTETKLLWQDNFDNINVMAVEKDWQGAIDYCENLSLAGFDDWKLPDIDTLKALYPKKDMLIGNYWSSSPNPDDSDYALVFDFTNGYEAAGDKTYSTYVRCVRAGKVFETLSLSSFREILKTTSEEPISQKLYFVQTNDIEYFGTIDDLAYKIEKKTLYPKKYYLNSCNEGNILSCEKLCVLGDAKLCNEIGMENNDIELLQKGCELKNAESCENVGLFYENGENQDFFKAAEYHQKACDGGIIESCHRVGILYSNDVALEPDYEKAVYYYQKACEGKHFESCFKLGYLYDLGETITQDYQKAFQFYEKACNGDMFVACVNLGVLYQNGEGVKQDYGKAMQYYQKSCNDKSSVGCNYLGLMYQSGFGVKKDLLKAADLYKTSCKADDEVGCSRYGRMFEYGYGVKRNKLTALAYYKKSCDLGYAEGCKQYDDLQISLK